VSPGCWLANGLVLLGAIGSALLERRTVSLEEGELAVEQSDLELQPRPLEVAQSLPFSGESVVFVSCSVVGIGCTKVFRRRALRHGASLITGDVPIYRACDVKPGGFGPRQTGRGGDPGLPRRRWPR
jgi:hypothetical protein